MTNQTTCGTCKRERCQCELIAQCLRAGMEPVYEDDVCIGFNLNDGHQDEKVKSLAIRIVEAIENRGIKITLDKPEPPRCEGPKGFITCKKCDGYIDDYENDCSCPPTEKEEECPCDFHTKDLTEEQARIALFKPIVGGDEATPLVRIERFHHLWDARRIALSQGRLEGLRMALQKVECRCDSYCLKETRDAITNLITKEEGK